MGHGYFDRAGCHRDMHLHKSTGVNEDTGSTTDLVFELGVGVSAKEGNRHPRKNVTPIEIVFGTITALLRGAAHQCESD